MTDSKIRLFIEDNRLFIKRGSAAAIDVLKAEVSETNIGQGMVHLKQGTLRIGMNRTTVFDVEAIAACEQAFKCELWEKVKQFCTEGPVKTEDFQLVRDVAERMLLPADTSDSVVKPKLEFLPDEPDDAIFVSAQNIAPKLSQARSAKKRKLDTHFDDALESGPKNKDVFYELSQIASEVRTLKDVISAAVKSIISHIDKGSAISPHSSSAELTDEDLLKFIVDVSNDRDTTLVEIDTLELKNWFSSKGIEKTCTDDCLLKAKNALVVLGYIDDRMYPLVALKKKCFQP